MPCLYAQLFASLPLTSQINPHFGLKPSFYFIEISRFNGRHLPKMMAMPNTVLAVVTKNTPVVAAMDFSVYERKIKAHNLSIGIHPDFPSQLSVSAAS